MMIINAKIKISEEKRDEYLKLMEHLVLNQEKRKAYYSIAIMKMCKIEIYLS